ncbi:MAG: cyclic nucleotide-binding domain-containing protein [Campylobacterales bacterium]
MFHHTEYTPAEIKLLLEVGSVHKRRELVSSAQADDEAQAAAAAQAQEPAQPAAREEVDLPPGVTAAQHKLMEIASRIYLFEGLTPQDVLKITKNVRFMRFKPKEILFSQGEIGREIFFILSGKIDVKASLEATDRHPKTTATVGRIDPGNILGEMAFITHRPRSATGISAAENTTAIGFEIDDDAVSEETAFLFLQLYINISHGMAEKLERCNTLLLRQG